jgi:Kdo2-lipid IVA lauroyltransferase/acyltransferase
MVSRLPLAVLYIISDAFFILAYYVIRYRKEVVARNLNQAFPEKSQKELKKIKKQFYRNFTDSFAETIKLLTMSKKELQKRFVIKNHGLVLDRVNNGEIVIGMCAHFFNWEGHLLSYNGLLDNRCETVYMKINSPFFDELMNTIRSRMGGELTDRYFFQRKYLKDRNKNRLIVLAADQRPNKSDIRYWATFMNKETAFFEGAEKLAKKFNHAVIYAHVSKPKRGQYVFQYQLLETPPFEGSCPHSITDKFIALTEKNIREEPSLYLWSHNRWK